MTKFVGCIDLHQGKVKQIVGGKLTDSSVEENFVSEKPSSYYANLFKSAGLRRCHVIKLGPGNDEAAAAALSMYPGRLHVGGGINVENAMSWIERGAEKVIVTSFLFPAGELDVDRLKQVSSAVGKDRLVIDLSCRRVSDGWIVAMDRWQRRTNFYVTKANMEFLANYCSEFLVHGVDVEGLCQGVDTELVTRLAEWSPLPVVYAGGARNIGDLELVKKVSNGRVDLTFGSALDIFGGSGARFDDLVEWNNKP